MQGYLRKQNYSSKHESLQTLVDKLVHNRRIKPSLLNHRININIKRVFYLCQAAACQMVQQGHGGSIIGVSSVSALVGGGLQTHYTLTKAAILSMMQSMAIALRKNKIRCNALLPGTINTQLADHDMKKPYQKGCSRGAHSTGLRWQSPRHGWLSSVFGERGNESLCERIRVTGGWRNVQ